MPKLTIHVPAEATEPMLHFCRAEARCVHTRDISPAQQDDYGWIFVLDNAPAHFTFTISNQGQSTGQSYQYGPHLGPEVWCRLYLPELYTVKPAVATTHVNEVYEAIRHLVPENFYLPETDVTGAETHSMLGATPLKDGRLLFSLFHPRAARVYVTGTFNNWQHPGHPDPNPEEFIPMQLYRGYYNVPNIWLALITPDYSNRDWEYAYYIRGGVHLDHHLRAERLVPDPMTRAYGRDFQANNSRVINPSHYVWKDRDWQTPQIQDLIIYEASVYGMTQGTPGIPPSEQGTFRGLATPDQTRLLRIFRRHRLGPDAHLRSAFHPRSTHHGLRPLRICRSGTGLRHPRRSALFGGHRPPARLGGHRGSCLQPYL